MRGATNGFVYHAVHFHQKNSKCLIESQLLTGTALEAVRTNQIVEERCNKFLGETMQKLDRLEAISNRLERVEKPKLCNQLDTDMKDLKKTLHEDIITKQNEPKEIITYSHIIVH